MGDKIDMSLDDIIKTNKKGGRGGGRGGNRGGGVRGRGRGQRGGRQQTRGGGGRGVFRGGVQKRRSGGGGAGGLNRSFGRSPKGNAEDVWQHDMYDGSGGRGGGVKRSGVGLVSGSGKLHISNLDFGVSESDIQELFEEFGPLRKAAVHYDRSGRSLGTAEVIYERRSDAAKALKQYNNVPLDGRPMNIQLIGASESLGASPQSRVGQRPGGGGGAGGQRRSNGFSGGRGRGGGRGGRGSGGRGGRGRGRGGADKKSFTAEELDAQLDAYNAKMETD